jgi:hypothetical protein
VFKANSTSASVKLWNTGANGTIVADAVHVREVGAVERTTRNKVVADDLVWGTRAGATVLLADFNHEIGSINLGQTVAPGDYRDETGRWWAVPGERLL